MVLDAKWVLANQITLEGVDDLPHRLGIPPAGRLANTGKARVRRQANDVATADEERFNSFDLHANMYQSEVCSRCDGAILPAALA